MESFNKQSQIIREDSFQLLQPWKRELVCSLSISLWVYHTTLQLVTVLLFCWLRGRRIAESIACCPAVVTSPWQHQSQHSAQFWATTQWITEGLPITCFCASVGAGCLRTVMVSCVFSFLLYWSYFAEILYAARCLVTVMSHICHFIAPLYLQIPWHHINAIFLLLL